MIIFPNVVFFLGLYLKETMTSACVWRSLFPI